MKLALVVAMSTNHAIGSQGELPWHLPEDLKRFKSITMGHPMIMGRVTYESIGRPLPGRMTIVVTRDKSWLVPEGVLCAYNIEEAVVLAKAEAKKLAVDTVMVVGGALIYEQLIAQCDSLYVTEVHKDVEGDAFFPKISPECWIECDRCHSFSRCDERLEYSFVEYTRG